MTPPEDPEACIGQRLHLTFTRIDYYVSNELDSLSNPGYKHLRVCSTSGKDDCIYIPPARAQATRPISFDTW